MLENKQGMVSKYKTLNQAHRKTLAENEKMAAELAQLRQGGGSRAASPSIGNDAAEM